MSLLLDEPPLVISPTLAARIGLNEAIVMQQIHYWLVNFQRAADPRHYHDGRWWVWNSVEHWRTNFPFWSAPTIKRTLANLRHSGLVLTANYNAAPMDRTTWYSIDYAALDALLAAPAPSDQPDPIAGSDCTDAPAQPDPIHEVTVIQAIPETTSETTLPENTTREEDGGAAAPRPPSPALAAASGAAALAHAAAGGVPWSVPGASYPAPSLGQPADPRLRAWLPLLAGRKWSGGTRPADILTLAGRFADPQHADLALPAPAERSAVRDWTAALEQLLILATPQPATGANPPGQRALLDLRVRRACWLLDWIFYRRERGDRDYSGFSITRPGSVLKIARLAEQALRAIQDQECLDPDVLPPLSCDPNVRRPFGPDDDAMRAARAQAEAIRNRSRHASPAAA